MKKKKDIETIIQQCDPAQATKRFRTGGRCGNEGLFQFCQQLKSITLRFDDSAEQYLRQWYDRWSPSLADDSGRVPPFDEIAVMAEGLWGKIKFSDGGQLGAAIDNADRRYDETIPELDGYGGAPERRLALVCYELSTIADPEAFFLSGYDAAVILGLDRVADQKRGDLALKVFVRRGVLSVAKKHTGWKATRYYFTGSSPIKIK